MTATRIDALVGDVAPERLGDIRTLLRALGEIPPSLPRPIRYGLTKGLLDHGRFFIAGARVFAEEEPENFARLYREVREIELAWLRGDSLSDRADEDDLRAQHALWVMENIPGLARIAANAVLKLPAEHPLRDSARVRDAVLEQLRYSLTKPLVVSGAAREVISRRALAVSSMAALIEHKLVPDDHQASLFDAGLEIVRYGRLPESDAVFGRAVLPYAWGRVSEARDRGIAAEQREWEAIAFELAAHQIASEPDPRKRQLLELMVGRMRGEGSSESILRNLAPPNAFQSQVAPDKIELFARLELAELQLGREQFGETIATLTPVLPLFAERYLSAVATAHIQSAGEEHARACRMLAFANARLDRWDDAIRLIDDAKSLRFRYQTALRATPDATRVIELEAALHDRERGVRVAGGSNADPNEAPAVAIEASADSRLLEAFRSIRARLAPEYMQSPSIRTIAESLRDDEALAVLGYSPGGVLLALVCSGDADRPTACELLSAASARRIVEGLIGHRHDGWFVALNAPELVEDPHAALSAFLDAVDAEIGSRLRVLLDRQGVRRATIVPHDLLHLAPFWALPSLVGISVRTAPCAAMAIRRDSARHPIASALVVGNPTRDLRFASVEAGAVEQHLTRTGFHTALLPASAATEARLTQHLAGANILHFAGHGISDAFRPLRSALEVAPDAASLGSDGGDPLPALLSGGTWSALTDNERHIDLPDGSRLWERLHPATKRIDLRRETGRSGTLLGRYEWADADDAVGPCIRLAELWTVSDILRTNALRDCHLVVLSACSAGLGALLPSRDEFAGLPAALQLAGVRTVITSLWLVDEVLAALFFDLFYEALVSRSGVVDVAAVLHEVRRRVADMSRDEAATRVERLADQGSTALERALLSARALKLRRGGARPFEHPFDWAAFHVLGETVIELPESPNDERVEVRSAPVPASVSPVASDESPPSPPSGEPADRPPQSTPSAGEQDLAELWTFLAEKTGEPVIVDSAAGELVKRANVRLRSGDAPGALADAERALKFAPSKPEAHTVLGRALNAMGRLDEAIPAFSRAITIDPEATDALAGRASLYITMERYVEAVADLSSVLERQEDNVPVRFTRGLLRQQLGDRRDAIDDFSRVIELWPERADAYEARSDCYEEHTNYQEAIDDLSAVIVLKPRAARLVEHRGFLAAALGRYDDAIRDYDESLRIDDSLAATYYNRACSVSLRGRGTRWWRDWRSRHAACTAISTDLTRAFALDPETRDAARTDPELEWARRSFRRIRRLLR